MNKESCFVLSYLLVASFLSGVISISDYDLAENITSIEWDIVLFTQQWPVTTCYHWMEEGNRNCNLPNKNEFWTIHGIWPSKSGNHYPGPSFCNNSAKFDVNKLAPIVDDLKLFWPTIISQNETDLDNFWKHEWLKHGTCAASAPEMSDEEEYFNQGLEWREKFLISDILGKSGIHPDSENTVINIQMALMKVLGKNPSIHCIYDRKKDVSYLSEIRLCFNRSLEIIDCDGIMGEQVAIDYPGGKVITNCHVSKPVQYPSIVPPTKRDAWKFPFVNLYKLLSFIMWFTL